MDTHASEKWPNYLSRPNDRLRRHRKMRHWTQAGLADELYQLCEADESERGIINANMIGAWERGEHQPSLYWQKKLCQLFGTTPDELGFLDISPQFSASKRRLSTERAKMHHASLGQHSSADASWYPALALYLQHQRARLLDAIVAGSTHLRVGDIIGDQGLFISPPWRDAQGIVFSSHLLRHVLDAIERDEQILLLGDAGQGKTTILKHVFAHLADNFLRSSSQEAIFPLYIPLRDLSSLTGTISDILWKYIGEDFPLSLEDFAVLVRQHQIVLLLDGFDEIQSEVTQRLINERAASKLFSYPSVLTCRKGFFDFYLSMSPIQENYVQKIELQPLALTDSVRRYITTFCRHKQQAGMQQEMASPQTIMTTLHTNQGLQDLARRPLLLLMILELFTGPKDMGKEAWSATKLYTKYTEWWLKHEAAKPDSLLKWHEKAALLQEVAWSTYEHSPGTSTFTQQMLNAVVQHIAVRYAPLTTAQLLDDLCFRTLLVVSEGENYTFLHQSFQEYYVARYVFDRMRFVSEQPGTLEAIEQVLQASLPFDVAIFLKEMLSATDISPYEKELVATNLIAVYQRNRAGNSVQITIRQQASHYLTSLGTPRAIAFLEQICNEEHNKWVQRGIMVGLALYCGRRDMLDRYILLLRNDPEMASINLGYHLIYYGDHAYNTDYHVAVIDRCERTVAALFRHLGDERYKNGWALDILTLTTLIEQVGMSLFTAQPWHMSFLAGFLSREHPEQCDIFQQEKERLKHLLEGETTWNEMIISQNTSMKWDTSSNSNVQAGA